MMNYKRLSILFLLVLMIGSLSANFVVAVAPNPATDPIKAVIYNIVTLGFLKDLGFASVTADPLEGTIRFLIFLLIFALIFRGVELLGLGRNTSVIIALVFSAISAVFIPGVILLAAATAYGTIFSLILIAIPVVIGILAYYALREHHWARFIVIVLLIIVLHIVQTSLDPTEGLGTFATQFKPIIETVQTAFTAVLVLAYLLAFVALIQLFAGTGALDSENLTAWENSPVLKGLKKIGNAGISLFTKIENEFLKEQEELKTLHGLQESIEAAYDALAGVAKQTTIEMSGWDSDVKPVVEKVVEGVAESYKGLRQAQRKTSRQQKQARELIKKLKDEGDLEASKEGELLNILENDILKKHSDAFAILEEVNTKILPALINAYDKSREKVEKSSTPVVVKAVLFSGIKNMAAALTAMNAKIKGAIKAEDGVVEDLQKIIAEIEGAHKNFFK